MRARGFTAVELMVTLAILAVLAAVAAPSFSSFSASQRLRAASVDLRTDLMLARSEALKRNQSVTISRRDDAGWHTGWVVLVEDSGEELRTRNELGRGVSVSLASSAITFNSGGRVESPGGVIRIELASSAGGANSLRCLMLDPSGMPRVYAEACT
jgi:type IV fimbrial biogenesis protein FimT